MLKGTFSYWSRTGQSSYAGVRAGLRALLWPWLLSIQPKILEISVRNQIERTILVQSNWNYHYGQSTNFDQSDQMSLSIWQFPLVVPSTALWHPAYKNNNQMRGGLGLVCATRMYCSIGDMEFLKFQTGVFVEWKGPLVTMPKIRI